MRRVLRRWAELVRDYADQFGVSPEHMIGTMFGVAACMVIVLDLVALAAVTTGGGR